MHPHADKKVLWVDDDPSMLEVGRMTLESAGYRFLAAQDGLEALRIVTKQQTDLILLDYSLGDMTGKELFELLVTEHRDISSGRVPVIMLTGRNSTEAERRALLSRGLTNYLSKPFGSQELLNLIENEFLISDIRERNRLLTQELQNANRQLQKTNQELQETHSSILIALNSLLTAKDNYTGEHSSAVLNFVAKVGRRLGLTDTEIYDLQLAALLHDIGKIGVPEAILCKPSRLDEQEKEIMDLHAVRGYEALSSIPNLKRISKMVLHHHEWWDGRGYPAKLAGEQIPLEARIIAVVDAFDAMTSDRPYRRGMSQQIALDRLQEGSGTQFDPKIVACFASCLDEGLLGNRNIELPAL